MKSQTWVLNSFGSLGERREQRDEALAREF